MIIKIIIILIAIGILVLGISKGIYKDKNDRYLEGFKLNPLCTGLIACAVAVFICALSFTIVPRGYVGVVTKFSAVTERTLQPGLHTIIPFVNGVEQYQTKQLTYETSDNPESSNANYTDYSVDTMTADGQRVTVRFTIVFSVDGNMAGYVAQNIGSEADLVEKIVKSNARSEARNVPKSFIAEDLYGENVYACQAAIFDKLNPVFAQSGVILHEVLLRDIGFSDELAQALENKQIALENQVTAQRNIEVKSAEASQTIVAAAAQAESIRLINEQLAIAPYYNQYLIAKGISEGTTDISWVIPESSLPVFNIDNLKKD